MHVPGIIEDGKVVNHDRLVSVVGKQDIDFFDAHPDRTYRARPADPMEVFEFRNVAVVDEAQYQPAIIVKRWRHNGYEFLTRQLRGAPRDINLYALGDEYLRVIFEPTLH
jgi:hypothetical protein